MKGRNITYNDLDCDMDFHQVRSQPLLFLFLEFIILLRIELYDVKNFVKEKFNGIFYLVEK